MTKAPQLGDLETIQAPDDLRSGTPTREDVELPAGEGAAEPALPRGRTIGRYVVLDRIGAGGMGVVYAAYDPELDRKLALKVLLPRLAEQGSLGRSRLLREAQAMAKLAHPNVVTVHDVTSQGDQICIAMEFVAGVSLRQWLEATPRGWREVLRVFDDAARGLAAAHAQGIVHRDFKPDNVMVDEHGRARVMDFGIARVSALTSLPGDPASPEPAPGGSASSRDAVLTHAGMLMGTPAYMSPEQFSGGEVDGRSDQFSFCVALWEGLYGRRPHEADSIPGLLLKIGAGELVAPPRRSEVPSWVREVVARGLRPDPAERWPSMEALIEALHRDPTRWRRPALAAAGVAVLVLGGLGLRAWSQEATARACAEAGATLRTAWNDGRAAAIGQAFADTGLVHASAAFDATRPWLDGWVGAWAQAREAACLATELEASRAPQLYALTRQCLDDRALALEVLLESFEAPSEGVVSSAVDLAVGLPEVSRCMDDTWLQRRPPRPDDPALSAQLAELQRELARAHVRFTDGEYEESEQLARAAMEEARSLPGQPFAAQAATLVGVDLLNLGRHEEAAKVLEDAYLTGIRSGDGEAATDAAMSMVGVMSALRRHEEALHWGRLADVSAEGVGPTDFRLADRLDSLSNALLAHGDYDAAITELERALALRREELGDEHPFVATIRSALSQAYLRAGRYDDAEAESRRAVALLEQTIGPKHPNTARGRLNLADVLMTRGDLPAAAAEIRAAIEILSVTVSADDPVLAVAHNNLGGVLLRQGQTEPALAELREASRLLRSSVGEDHPNVALLDGNISAVLAKLGRADEAETTLRAAIRTFERTAGPEQPQAIALRSSLIGELVAGRELAAAEAVAREGLEATRKAVGTHDPRTASYEHELGMVLVAAGRHDDARAALEAAWAVRETAEVEPIHRAGTAWALAQRLEDEPERARALALTARELLQGAPNEAERQAIDAWLAAHPAQP